ncbi:MAG: DUF2461 domain-containing protein [Flavobacteriales bacterium]|nr:DUF2461 domain-containing protein [Flavobacteriales bacterium]
MAWFTTDFNRFFKELAAHNNKEWFDANRGRYLRSVKEPFEAFVAEVIDRVGREDKRVRITPKEAIFRINKDVRFSKDKAPYKLHCAAIVSPAGRKDHGVPGIYFELGPEKVAFYGGSYMPDGPELKRIRSRISGDLKKFKTLCNAPAFVKHFGVVQGDRNKVIPAEFKTAAEKEPLLFNKQFYFMAGLPAGKVTDPRLADILMEHYAAMRPLNDFLMAR